MSLSRSYSITANPERLALDKKSRTGEVSFTVTNRTDRPLNTEVRPRTLESTADDWLELPADKRVREIGAGKSTQCTVGVKVPSDATPGDYRFRLDANSVNQPEEIFTEGPVVVVTVPPGVVEEDGFEFRWWMAVAAVVALVLVGGLIAWLRSGSDAPAEVPELVYTSERVRIPATQDGERLTVHASYRVKLLHPPESRVPLAEFVLEEATVNPPEGFEEMINPLLDTSGTVPIDEVEELDLSKSWEAYARMSRDFEEDMAVDPEKEGFEAMGKGLMLIVATTQIVFDLKAILMTVPTEAESDFEPLILQEGSRVLADFRVEGPPAPASGGLARRFNVVRRKHGEETFTHVGTASYDTATGLLRTLDISYRPDEEHRFYRLTITRRD